MPLGPPSKHPSKDGSTAEPAPEPAWSLVHRGSFVLGSCEACGYRSPARRARYSVEEDMGAHELLCRSARDLQAVASEPGLPGGGAAPLDA